MFQTAFSVSGFCFFRCFCKMAQCTHGADLTAVFCDDLLYILGQIFVKILCPLVIQQHVRQIPIFFPKHYHRSFPVKIGCAKKSISMQGALEKKWKTVV